MRYTTILFDFDGTLTPSLPLWQRAFQYAFEKYGHNMSGEEVISKCFYRSWHDIVSKFELPSVGEFSAHVHTGLEEAFADAYLFDGVAAVLEHFREKDMKLAIVTSSTRKVVDKFIKTHRIERYFESVVTADDITYFKPHPEPVHLALSVLQKDVNNCLMIGDSSADMLAAQAAGVHKGLFYPAEHAIFYKLDDLKQHDPHHIFHSYADILAEFASEDLPEQSKSIDDFSVG